MSPSEFSNRAAFARPLMAMAVALPGAEESSFDVVAIPLRRLPPAEREGV